MKVAKFRERRYFRGNLQTKAILNIQFEIVPKKLSYFIVKLSPSRQRFISPRIYIFARRIHSFTTFHLQRYFSHRFMRYKFSHSSSFIINFLFQVLYNHLCIVVVAKKTYLYKSKIQQITVFSLISKISHVRNTLI